MSTYFSKVIKAGERQREFNFRQVTTGTYSVDVPDEKGNRLTFSMYQNADGLWQTSAQSMPIWIHYAQESLAEAIEEHRNLESVKKK